MSRGVDCWPLSDELIHKLFSAKTGDGLNTKHQNWHTDIHCSASTENKSYKSSERIARLCLWRIVTRSVLSRCNNDTAISGLSTLSESHT